ncbi:hypothetical protein SGLAM104S_05402 [Streptomyces glaucescens]|jgi:hypothetical protein
MSTPRQLKALLLPHQRDTDHVRRALRNLLAESPALAVRTHRAQRSYWCCTSAGLAETAASGELAPTAGRTTGKRVAASTTCLREHGLALIDTVNAIHQAQAADHTDWQVQVAHPTHLCGSRTHVIPWRNACSCGGRPVVRRMPR